MCLKNSVLFNSFYQSCSQCIILKIDLGRGWVSIDVSIYKQNFMAQYLKNSIWMWKFLLLIFVLKQLRICYYISCMTVPLIKCRLINTNIVGALFKKINRGLFLLNIGTDLSTSILSK